MIIIFASCKERLSCTVQLDMQMSMDSQNEESCWKNWFQLMAHLQIMLSTDEDIKTCMNKYKNCRLYILKLQLNCLNAYQIDALIVYIDQKH